jgi:hypothetical protein
MLINPQNIPGPLWSRNKMPDKLPLYYQNKLRILEKIDAYPSGHADIINIPPALHRAGRRAVAYQGGHHQR